MEVGEGGRVGYIPRHTVREMGEWRVFLSESLLSLPGPARAHPQLMGRAFHSPHNLHRCVQHHLCCRQGWEGYFRNVIGYRLQVTLLQMKLV